MPWAGGGALTARRLQIDYHCRLDCLWKNKFKKEQEEFATMENVNRLLLENVLPAHVAAHFIGDKLNEVRYRRGSLAGGVGGQEVPVWASPTCPQDNVWH